MFHLPSFLISVFLALLTYLYLFRLIYVSAPIVVGYRSRVGTEWVPQAGMAFHLPHAAELKASVSNEFRYPILREMYNLSRIDGDKMKKLNRY